MISTARTDTIVHRYDSAKDIEPRTETETRYIFNGSGRLSISRGCIDFADPYGIDDRTLVSMWFDNDEVVSAIVDLIASLHDGAKEECNSNSRERCRETLARVAGAMGIDYEAVFPDSVKA